MFVLSEYIFIILSYYIFIEPFWLKQIQKRSNRKKKLTTLQKVKQILVTSKKMSEGKKNHLYKNVCLNRISMLKMYFPTLPIVNQLPSPGRRTRTTTSWRPRMSAWRPCQWGSSSTTFSRTLLRTCASRPTASRTPSPDESRRWPVPKPRWRTNSKM